jgi:regulator of sigma E protease
MQSLLFTAASFVLALAILITVHELGHFWVARKLGVKVLRFSIGFGRPLFKWVSRKDGTEYVVAAVPLGGYVKMLDEREAPVPADEQDLAFNRQVLWRRFAIVAAGPLFNFLFAILAYWGILVVGDTGTRALVGEVKPDSIASQAQFAPGDELLMVGERHTATWESAVFALMAEVLDGRDLPVRVRSADGSESVRLLPGPALAELPDDPAILSSLGLSPARPVLPAVIGQLVAGEPAEQAGLKPGDRVLRADGEDVDSWREWVEIVQDHPNETLMVTIDRGGDTLEVALTPRTMDGASGPVGRIGAAVQVEDSLFDDFRAEVRLGPVDALRDAVVKTVDMSMLMLRVIGRMLVGKASVENLSGPISIAETAGKTASYGLGYFVKFLAVVSISLGVLNLLPIPVLDGGHLMYFAIEAVKGSPLSEQAQMQGQRIGIAILAALMTLAFYVDISRLLAQ